MRPTACGVRSMPYRDLQVCGLDNRLPMCLCGSLTHLITLSLGHSLVPSEPCVSPETAKATHTPRFTPSLSIANLGFFKNNYKATCGGFAPPPIALNSMGLSCPSVSTDLVNRPSRHPRFRVVIGSVAYQPAHYAKPFFTLHISRLVRRLPLVFSGSHTSDRKRA